MDETPPTAIVRLKLAESFVRRESLKFPSKYCRLLEAGFSASGVFLSDGRLVTTATIAAPFVGLARKLADDGYRKSWKRLVQVEVAWKRRTWSKARVVALARNQILAQKLTKFFGGGENLKTNSTTNDATAIRFINDLERESKIMIFDFLLVTVDLATRRNLINVLPTNQLHVGQDVYLYGTPFGSTLPDVFLNSVTKGIISIILDDVILLTDARYVVGVEGGALFVKKQSKIILVGIVISPLTSSLLGLTIVASIQSIVESFQPSLFDWCHHLFPWSSTIITPPSLEKHVLPSIVAVETGARRGSAVIIDENSKLALTCSHVLSNKQDSLTVTLSNKKCTANVLWASALPDIALLKLNTSEKLCALHGLSSTLPSPSDGSNVFVIGYPQLCGGGDNFLSPVSTHGVVAKRICCHDDDSKTTEVFPVMLQLTAPIWGGSSGGAVVCAQSGRLVGIATSTIRDETTGDGGGTIMPNVSLAIPIEWIRMALKEVGNREQNHHRQQHTTEEKRTKRAAAKLWQLSTDVNAAVASHTLFSKL